MDQCSTTFPSATGTVLSASWCNGASSPVPPREWPSGGQHPRPQQVEARPSVAPALYELELACEPFHRTVAPPFGQPGAYRIDVLPQAGGKAPHRGGFARPGLLEPPAEFLPFEALTIFVKSRVGFRGTDPRGVVRGL